MTRHSFISTASVSLIILALGAGCGGEDPATNNGSGGAQTTSGTGGAAAAGATTTTPQGGAPAAGGNGAGGEDPFACGQASSAASLKSLPADLIVAVDNSDSMAFEAAQVKSQIGGLVAALSATGIDAHVVMISKGANNTFFDILETGVCAPAPLGSGSCPADENLPTYRHVLQEVASHDALEQIVATYDDWKDSLRPEATKTFLVVSDDESAMSASAFADALAALDPPITNFKFDAVVASEAPYTCALCAISGCQSCTNPCCDKSLACLPLSMEKGLTYMELQNQTSGVYGDLCVQNFAPAFSDMATAVIEHTAISCALDIPAPPEGVLVPSETNVKFIPTEGASPQSIYNVAADTACTINGGWYFDDNDSPSEIHLCPSTCELVKQSTEGEIRVEFGCQTETIPS